MKAFTMVVVMIVILVSGCSRPETRAMRRVTRMVERMEADSSAVCGCAAGDGACFTAALHQAKRDRYALAHDDSTLTRAHAGEIDERADAAIAKLQRCVETFEHLAPAARAPSS